MNKTLNNLSKLSFLILSISLVSCNFNKVFLHPTKIPLLGRKATIRTQTDTTIILFSGDNHQPLFTKNETDTINTDFTIESVLFKSTNGNNLNGWLLKPKNLTTAVTLLHLHGNAGCLAEQLEEISPLLKNGFQIFMFDYSGFGFSEGTATRENILIDANSALDYLKKRPDVINTKLVIYGQSIGGHLAAVVGSQRQNDIDGLVIEGGFSSHKDIGNSQIPVIGRIFVKEGYSAKRCIKKYHKPLLVIHSTEDDVIPFFMGKRIYDHANSPKEFYEIKHGHIEGPRYYPDEISAKIKNMLKAN